MDLWSLLPIVTILYVFFDVNYFIRILWTVGLARIFQKKINLFESSIIYGFCTTNDVDIFLRHMNNARYIRELDFARFHFYDRTGIYDEITKLKGNALQGASNIRYRRTIPIFSLYVISTKLVWWDDKALYLEQKFVTLNDGFVRAVTLSKQNIVGVNVDQLMTALNGNKPLERPDIPDDVDYWLKSIEVASAKLRKRD